MTRLFATPSGITINPDTIEHLQQQVIDEGIAPVDAQPYIDARSQPGDVWMKHDIHGVSDTGAPRTYSIFEIRLPSGHTITCDAEREQTTRIIPEAQYLSITDTRAFGRCLVGITEYLQTVRAAQ